MGIVMLEMCIVVYSCVELCIVVYTCVYLCVQCIQCVAYFSTVLCSCV